MKKMVLSTFYLIMLHGLLLSQPTTPNNLFLGQTPPGTNPVKFELLVNTGSFAAERIAISKNGDKIYYTEVQNYYPVAGDTIKYFKYSGFAWTGPFNLFSGYLAPTLSVTGDTMYFQNNNFQNNTINYETYMSVRNGEKWRSPKRILKNLNSAHYLQVTNKETYFISSISKNSVGAGDWCTLNLNGPDTVASGLGRPLNTEWDNLDFFVARDESLIIVSTVLGLAVSYPTDNGNWTCPKNLGGKINFGLASWGPYLTPDNKYLFYTTGTKPDYSDVGVYWIRVDGLLDSLKFANSPPYVKNRIENQNALAGKFFNFTIPDNTFFDEDGTTTFTYSSTLNTGQALPSWLNFDHKTKTYSGTPPEPVEYIILFSAADEENALGIGLFKILVTNKN